MPLKLSFKKVKQNGYLVAGKVHVAFKSSEISGPDVYLK